MITMREAVFAALRRDPELIPKVKASLRERIAEGEEGPIQTVVQAAGALAPIIEEAVGKRPSRIGKLGLRSAHLLANLAVEDQRSNQRLTRIASGRTMGIVFADVAGFTSYTAEKGDAAASRLIATLQELVDKAARSAGGECVKALGDGFLLAFPSASQAVRGAVALRDTVAAERARSAEFPVRLRIAVHAGEPLVEHDDLLGHDVNLTARLLDHCKPGGVLVSEVAKELAEKRLKKIAWGRRRLVKIRGLAGKVAAYPVSVTEDPAP